MRRPTSTRPALELLLVIVAGAASGAAAPSVPANLLDRSADTVSARARVPSDDKPQGEVRLVDTGSRAARDAVRTAGKARVDDLERRLRARGIDFIHIDASGSIVDPLVHFFRMRGKRGM